MEDKTVKAYSIKEVSEKTDVAEGTIRQWEKDFELEIPRDRTNYRYFTDKQIDIILKIKEMRSENVSKSIIKKMLEKHISEEGAETQLIQQDNVQQLKQSEAIEALQTIQKAMETFPEVKERIVEELKYEIKDNIQHEVNESFEKQNELIKAEFKKLQESQQKLLEEKEKKGFFARLFKR